MPERQKEKISVFHKKFIDNITFFCRMRYDIDFLLSQDLRKSQEYLDKILVDIEEEDVTIIKNKWKYPLSSLFDYEEGFDVDEYLNSIEDEEKRSRIKEIMKEQMLYQLEQEHEIHKHFTGENLKSFLDRFHLLFLYSEFEQFLFSSVKSLILKYPNSLNEKTISIKQILERDKDFDLIIQEKAEAVTEQLLREDFNKFFQILSEKPYGFKVELEKNILNELNEFKQLRNAFIHGDGTVSLIYLSKIKNNNLKLREKLPLGIDLLFKKQNLLFSVLRKFDNTLLDKIPELEITLGSKTHTKD